MRADGSWSKTVTDLPGQAGTGQVAPFRAAQVLKGYIMNTPEWLKPELTGGVAGGIAVTIPGFSWAGWPGGSASQIPRSCHNCLRGGRQVLDMSCNCRGKNAHAFSMGCSVKWVSYRLAGIFGRSRKADRNMPPRQAAAPPCPFDLAMHPAQGGAVAADVVSRRRPTCQPHQLRQNLHRQAGRHLRFGVAIWTPVTA